MPGESIIEYIRTNLKNGFSEKQIRDALLENGYDTAYVDKAFERAVPLKASGKPVEQPYERGWRDEFDKIGRAVREQKPEKGFIYCNKCGMEFSDRDKAEKHMKKCGNPLSLRMSSILYAIGAWFIPLGSFMIALYPETHASDSVLYIKTTFPYLLFPSLVIGFIFFYMGAKNHQKNIYMRYKKTLSWWLYIVPLFGSAIGFIMLIGWIRENDKKLSHDFIPFYGFTIAMIIGLTAAFLLLGTFLIDLLYQHFL